MFYKYGKIIKTVTITILFCSLAFGQKNRQANVPPSRDIRLHTNFTPQETFQTITDSNTTLIGRWANGPCVAVDVSGNIAYFGNGGYLEVVDISDPANPIELGKVLTPSEVSGVAVSGSYAYVADGWKGLRIIDVSTPSSPVEVGFYYTGVYAFGVAVSGSYAYVADKYDGLRIIDVSTPSNPTEVGFYDTGGSAWSIAVSGDLVYVADGDDGLYIIRNDMAVSVEDDNHLGIPIEFALDQNYPNPFNPVTTISYQLSKSAFVNLSIYNITGQLVKTIVYDYKSPGFYTVEWNASNVGSGIYFYKILAGEFTKVRKYLFVK